MTLSLFVFSGCNKHKNDILEENPAAIITFSSPTAGASYHSNDSIAIKGRAIAANTMHGYDLIIKKVSNTTVYYTKHIHDHNDTLVIDQKWKSLQKTATNLEAHVIVYLDHDGHTASKKVGFTVQ